MDTPVIKRIALYARVSTLNGQKPQLQLDELRTYAQARGWVVYSEYVDLGISGSKDSRPELNRMLADAHARKVDAILVWKLDRLGRSLKHLVTVIEDLEHYGVSFVSLRDNIDMSTPSGRLMMHLATSRSVLIHHAGNRIFVPHLVRLPEADFWPPNNFEIVRHPAQRVPPI
jgi:DNA invertase Pin-like site-specific DNA recombinase